MQWVLCCTLLQPHLPACPLGAAQARVRGTDSCWRGLSVCEHWAVSGGGFLAEADCVHGWCCGRASDDGPVVSRLTVSACGAQLCPGELASPIHEFDQGSNLCAQQTQLSTSSSVHKGSVLLERAPEATTLLLRGSDLPVQKGKTQHRELFLCVKVFLIELIITLPHPLRAWALGTTTARQQQQLPPWPLLLPQQRTSP